MADAAIPSRNAVTPSRRRRVRRRSRAYVAVLYFLAILREFRWTLAIFFAFVAAGTVLFAITPHDALGHRRPSLLLAAYCTWMAMLAQPVYNPPETWYLTAITGIYPVLGFVLIGEGIVRLALLMVSRRQGEREWMRVMASTYRDHVILCGLGHLGYRILQQLTVAGVSVVVLEKNKAGRFVSKAKEETSTPILIRDMKEDQALLDAGVRHARAVVIATNDDMANLEVALDSRRLNPGIRVVMRLFDQEIASKLAGALSVDVAFSSSSLAAPMVAAMSLETKVLSSSVIAGTPHVTCEFTVAGDSPLAGKRVDHIEQGYSARVLARLPKGGPPQSPPSPAMVVEAEDTLVVHTAAAQLATLSAAGRAGE